MKKQDLVSLALLEFTNKYLIKKIYNMGVLLWEKMLKGVLLCC